MCLYFSFFFPFINSDQIDAQTRIQYLVLIRFEINIYKDFTVTGIYNHVQYQSKLHSLPKCLKINER